MFGRSKKFNRSTETVALKQESPGIRDADSDISNSRAAGIISGRFDSDSVKHVLDFGHLTQQAVDYFARFDCHYDVLDLYYEFRQINLFKENMFEDEIEKTATDLSRLINKIPAKIDKFGGKKYDVIFLWDIINYISSKQANELISQIKSYCHLKTHVLCLFPVTREIPRLPMICSIIAPDKSVYRHRSHDKPFIKNPEHDRGGLPALANGFTLIHSSLLQNGIKESVYSLKRKKEY